ncbi:TIGR03086 family metal-binding protein [Actinomadura sp. 7K507]|uniref:TIGR03086 family metal-binding protein n=1 Tax=Actinomadura sp. 7K507 TaxID=2530365 RepID=UPI00104DACE0|nr:TIGR03086 family metal-binding protein [Actinomadura sp. 7K507]TDC93552.1 TIGR03086 family protein [Actinomadura sp. 7K507]
MNENHAYMKECAAEAARIAQGVQRERLGDATPCGEFDLRTLVNHLVLYTSHGLERRALREELPDELTERDFTADAAWPQEYAVQLDRAVAAWADPAVWDGDIGGTPAADVAVMMTLEMALHGWDVAKATGQEYGVSPETGGFVLQVVEKYAEMYRQYDGFGGAVPAGPDAPPFERAVAASGRDPHWRPDAG